MSNTPLLPWLLIYGAGMIIAYFITLIVDRARAPRGDNWLWEIAGYVFIIGWVAQIILLAVDLITNP